MERPDPPLAATDHVCDPCGIVYHHWAVEDAVAHIDRLPDLVAHAVDGVPAQRLARRPAEDVWSPAEYVCHLRDVHMTSTIRLYRVRTEDRPVLEPMLNDLRARRFGYRGADVPPVVVQLRAAAAGLLAEVDRVGDWDRVGTRVPGEERDATWLVRQAAHEGIHHLGDLRAGLDGKRYGAATSG